MVPLRLRRRRLLFGLGGALVVGGLAIAYLLGYLFPPPAPQPIALPEAPVSVTPDPIAPPLAERRNILLLGIDARSAGEQTRSDIMFLASVQPKTGELTLLSIPRDSYVEIPGHGQDKINHAHAFGGVALSMKTVANNLQVPIHHWARIDMPGFMQLIDVLGPVTVNVPEHLTLAGGKKLTAGVNQMDSKTALLYLRERYSDPRGDIGRTDRAGQFLLDLGTQARHNFGLGDLPRVFGIVTKYVETDMNLRDAATLARQLAGLDLNQVKRGVVQGSGFTLEGIYYYRIDEAETEKIMQSLGLR